MLHTSETLPCGVTYQRSEDLNMGSLETFLFALASRDPFVAADDAINARMDLDDAAVSHAYMRIAAYVAVQRGSWAVRAGDIEAARIHKIGHYLPSFLRH